MWYSVASSWLQTPGPTLQALHCDIWIWRFLSCVICSWPATTRVILRKLQSFLKNDEIPLGFCRNDSTCDAWSLMKFIVSLLYPNPIWLLELFDPFSPLLRQNQHIDCCKNSSTVPNGSLHWDKFGVIFFQCWFLMIDCMNLLAELGSTQICTETAGRRIHLVSANGSFPVALMVEQLIPPSQYVVAEALLLRRNLLNQMGTPLPRS